MKAISDKVDLSDVILKQSTLISLYVVCYYSVFYVIRLLSYECLLTNNTSNCVFIYSLFYAFFVFFLFVVFLLYVCKFLKDSVTKELENQIYFLIFIFYFLMFEVVSLILTKDLKHSITMVIWLNIPITLFCSYFYSALKVIYFDLKKINNKDITATIFSILLFFGLNLFGFLQAKEQLYDQKNIKKEEVVLSVIKK